MKADDLVFGQRDEIWRAFVEALVSRGLTGSIGVIGEATEAAFHTGGTGGRWILPYLDRIELWNHGYRHRKNEFEGRDLNAQAEAIAHTQAIIREVYGVESRAFGAPFNLMDQTTIDACESLGIPVIFGRGVTRKALLIERERVFAFETDREERDGRTIVNPHMRRFEVRYREAAERRGIAAMQLHPRRWDERGLALFGAILDRLIDHGCRFVRPGDLLAAHPSPPLAG